MKVHEYSIIFSCTNAKCHYLRSSSAFGGYGGRPYDMAEVAKNIGSSESCPFCSVGKISASKITVKPDKLASDPYQSWSFKMKCGKCDLKWETSLINHESKMKKHVFKPELSCPDCGNEVDNITISIRRTW